MVEPKCDRYAQDADALRRLFNEGDKYGALVIAFDFDNTVYDYHKVGDTYDEVIKLLVESKRLGNFMVCFTANDDTELVTTHLEEIGLGGALINESPVDVGNSSKLYYNLLLDDRAGLQSAVYLLAQLNEYQQQQDNQG